MESTPRLWTWLRRLLVGALALAAVGVGAVVLAPSLLETERLREGLQAELSEALGRPVTFGALHVTLLPDVLLSVDALTIGQTPGATWDATAKACRVGVGLVALLQGEVAIQSVALDEPSLTFTRGDHNDGDAGPLPAIPELAIRNGTLFLHHVGQVMELHIPRLDIQHMQEVKGTALLAGHQVSAEVHLVLLAGGVRIKRAELTTGTSLLALEGSVLPQQLDLTANGRVDFPALLTLLRLFPVVVPEELSLEGTSGVRASAQGVPSRALVQVELDAQQARVRWGQVADKPAGRVLTLKAAWETDPRAASMQGHVEGLTVRTASGVTSEIIHADATWKEGVLGLPKFLVRTLGTTLQGALAIRPLGKAPSVEGSIHADVVDVDVWQTAGGTSSTAGPEWTARVKAGAGVVKQGTLTLQEVDTQCVVQRGQVTLHPLQARAWDGTVEGKVHVDTRVRPAAWDVALTLKDVQAAPLLRETTRSEHGIHGVVKGHLALAGTAVADPLRSARGHGEITVDAVLWPGGKVVSSLSPMVAAVTGLQLGSVDLASITRIHGPVKLGDARVGSDALVLERPNGATLLNGWVTLDGGLDVLGQVIIRDDVVKTLPAAWSLLRNEHGGAVIPFVMRGTLREPVVTVDGARLAKAFAERNLPLLNRQVGAPAQGAQQQLLDAGGSMLQRLLRPAPTSKSR